MTRINNPGGGDCGFYAFAIGLIDVIQTEHQQGKTETFKRWHAKDARIQHHTLLSLDLHQLAASHDYKKDLLFQLQMSLRKIAVASLQANTQKNPEASILYSRFCELVHAHKEKNALYIQNTLEYNELVDSASVQALAEKTARNNLSPCDVFKKDIAANDHSLILKASSQLEKQGEWANHTSFKELAQALQVHFEVSGEPSDARPIDGRPTITLNNENHCHWTTEVALTPRIASTHTALTRQNLLSKHGFFAEMKQKYQAIKQEAIDIHAIDQAKALEGESDEAFALRLQEAEIALYRSPLK